MEEAGSDSLLGVVHLGDDRFAAYGAFGLYFDTTDAGKTWTRRVVIDEEFDRHISQVLPVGQSLLWSRSPARSRAPTMAAPPGRRSSHRTSGSYFGAIALQDGAILVFGMRSNVFRTVDIGATWQKIDLKTTASLNAGRQLADGRVLLVGNNGLLASSKDGGQTLELHWSPAGRGFAAVVDVPGSVILAGEAGITKLDPRWLEPR